MQALSNPDCQPPGSECPSFYVADLQVKAGFSEVHLLVFQIASHKKQNLDLWIEIAADDYAELLFMTGKLTVPVHAGTSTLVGLDPHAAKAAQQFFVSGNTVTLAVRPKGAGVTVKVGKQVDPKKVDKGEKTS
jgi:hypothetical protein